MGLFLFSNKPPSLYLVNCSSYPQPQLKVHTMLDSMDSVIVNEPQEMPAPAIAAISAGVPTASQEIKDLTMSDVDRSLTPAPANAPMFERGGYLNPEPAADFLRNSNSGDKNAPKSETLDAETKSYFIRMHQAADRFSKTMTRINQQKKDSNPSLRDIQNSQRQLKRQAQRYLQLNELGNSRLQERSSAIEPSLLREVNDDNKELNSRMDDHFKDTIKTGDLNLTKKEVGNLGDSMDKIAYQSSTLDTTINNELAQSQNTSANNRTPHPDDSGSNPSPFA